MQEKDLFTLAKSICFLEYWKRESGSQLLSAVGQLFFLPTCLPGATMPSDASAWQKLVRWT
jgi:hypothetical protein